jgi:hypothetical protein
MWQMVPHFAASASDQRPVGSLAGADGSPPGGASFVARAFQPEDLSFLRIWVAGSLVSREAAEGREGSREGRW